MITSLQGILTGCTPLRATVELNGLEYEVHVPVTTAERLPPPGAKVKLHTLVVYREDAQTMFGFSTAEERDFFRLMIEHVTGVGPKLALTIMSRLALPSLEAAIRLGDIATLARCPGIGKKTAERLVVELKAKVGSVEGMEAPVGGAGGLPAGPGAAAHPHRDAVSALITLGYRAADADQAIRRAALSLGPSATTEALIKTALGR